MSDWYYPRTVMGWDYPPGADHDPSAPYNQPEEDPDGLDTGWDYDGPDRVEEE